MATIKVGVKGEIATNLTPEVKLVCQNDKYEVEFDFDSSWEGSTFKTALFIYNGQVIPKPFDGNVVKIPAVYNTELLHIGIKSNDVEGLHTTTPARVNYLLSANDLTSNTIPEPTPEVYDEIIALLNKYIEQGGGDDPIDLKDYQKKVDENLETESKEIVGAINELHNREDKQGLTQEEVQEIVSKSELNTRKQLILGAEGVVEEQVYSFTVENAEDFLVYKTNLTKFLVDLNLPIVGDLETKKEVAITFGDTTYYVYNILKGMQHATIGDLRQVDKYNNQTGYRFITEMTFFQTSDIVGFAIIPTISVSDILALDSDEMDNYAADGGLSQGQLAVCNKVITNGYTEGALYRYKIIYPNTYEWEELSSGKIVDSDTITVMANGKAVSLHLNAEIVADIQRALKIPMSKPIFTELVGVDNTKSQVSIEIGEGLELKGNVLSATGGGEGGGSFTKEVVSIDIEKLLVNQDIELFLELSNRFINGEIVIVGTLGSQYGIITAVEKKSDTEYNWGLTTSGWYSTVDEVTPVVYVYGIELSGNELLIVQGEIANPDLTDYVKFTDYAMANKAGVIKFNPNGGAYSGVHLNKNGELVLMGTAYSGGALSDAFFNAPQNYGVPVLSKDLYRWMQVGLTQNNRTMTDEEKTKACDWLGAVKAPAKPSRYNYLMTFNHNGEAGTLAYTQGLDTNSIPQRDSKGNLKTNTPQNPTDCANKQFVEDLIAQLKAANNLV